MAIAPTLLADTGVTQLDLQEVFQGAPIIYSLLLILSLVAFTLWLYSLLTLRQGRLIPRAFMNEVRELLSEQRYEGALEACQRNRSFVARILESGLLSRKHGSQVVLESMQAEGRRTGASLWQRISLLNDVAVIAPMLGLLGTVMGMFLAFYDTDHSAESITSIFDGLGIAIGTTVAGLVVAISAMIAYSTLRLRVVRLMTLIENEALGLLNLMDASNKGA